MQVAIVGGGTVGLTTAWYLRERGIQTTIFEMAEPGNGASWGNAGQILPAKSLPLSEPGNLTFALKSFFKKNSPITAPKALNPHLIHFLLQFARNSTENRFHTGSMQMLNLGRHAVSEYQHMESKGISTTRKVGPFTAAFSESSFAQKMLHEYDFVKPYLESLDLELLDESILHSREPLLDDKFKFGLQLNGQSFIDPPQFVANLVTELKQSGVEIRTNCKVKDVSRVNSRCQVTFDSGKHESFDSVVIATGAWLNRLIKAHGVRMPVVAGVGYSMSVDVPHQTQGMLYFPEARLATTNYKNRLRISTFMQMTDVETPENPRRRQRLLDLAKQVIPKANWDCVTDFWSGGRPLSGDGKPLIGQTRTKGVYVNSGHGMWGITLAPVSAKELTNLIVDGKPLSPAFNPLR